MRFYYLLSGFFSVLSQVYILRELLSLFAGNEFSFGFLASGWMAGMGLGSFFEGRKRTRLSCEGQFLLLSFLFLGLVYLLRGAGKIFGLSPGEVLGSGALIITGFFFVFPLSFAMGMLFMKLTRVGEEIRGVSGIGEVYRLDAVGDTLAGAGFSYLFIHLPPLPFAFFISFLLSLPISLRKKPFIPLSLSLLALSFTPIPSVLGKKILEASFPGYKVIEEKDSPYTRITVLERDSILHVFQNNSLSFSFPSPFFEDVHLPMLFIPHPERILLIEAPPPVSREVKKHGVKKIKTVMLDPILLRVCREISKGEGEFIAGDGRKVVREGEWDGVFVMLPEPENLSSGRFYTVEFFREVKEHLREKGILFLKIPGSETSLSTPEKLMLSSLYFSLKKVFPDVLVLPGEEIFFIAGEKIPFSFDTLVARYERRRIKTLYFHPSLLPLEYNPERMRWIREEIEPAPLNTDPHPILPFFSMWRWNMEYPFLFRYLFPFLLRLPYLLLFLPLLFFIKRGIFFPVLCMGVWGITIEMLSLLSLQSRAGWVYHLAGLAISSFMLGIAGGEISGERRNLSIKLPFAISLLISLSFPFLLKLSLPPPLFLFLVNFGAGFSVGMLYPLAVKKLGGRTMGAGIIYGADLLGGALASFLTSLFLFSIYGAWKVLFLSGIYLLLPFLMLY
ncbi:hypothetical protein DRQ20_05330 [bacterium]|nr:MAG: hypothetical protein DRQ20_05330 [bacterium]